MRVVVVAGILLAVVLAGCTADEKPSDVNVEVPEVELLRPDLLPDGSEAPLRLEYTGCSEEFGVFPTPADGMASYVPEGFEPVPFDDEGLTVVVLAIAYTCAQGDEDVSEFLGFLAVEPSEAYLVEEEPEGFEGYAVLLGGYTTSDTVAEVFEAWHSLGAMETGDVMVGDLAPSNPVVQTRHVRADGESGVMHMYSTVPTGFSDAEAGSLRVFFVDTEEGSVSGAFDVSWNEHQVSDEGTAVLEFEGSLGPLSYVQPGLAYRFGGEGYNYVIDYVALPLEDDIED